MIYFDNAATSWPKPESVYKAMDHCSRFIGANPGRSGHRMSVEAGGVVLDAREAIAEIFNIEDTAHIALTFNATDSLNLGIKCLLNPGDHVITTSIEHNSVMRPLRYLEGSSRKIELSVAQANKDGMITVEDIESLIQENTRLVVITHASNVIGSIVPVDEIGAMLKKHKNIYYMVDCAQTGGVIPVDVVKMNVDLLAFPGHKGLLGPQGTGGLYVREGVEEYINSLKQGGTGSKSELEIHPDLLPDKYESGTKNTPGLAGLAAGIRFVLDKGIDKIWAHEQEVTSRFLKGVSEIEEITVYGPNDPNKQLSVVSLNVKDILPSELGYVLDDEYGIMTRVGLHCAPVTHKTIGTSPNGTVRFSMGFFTTVEEVDLVLEALKKIVIQKKNS